MGEHGQARIPAYLQLGFVEGLKLGPLQRGWVAVGAVDIGRFGHDHFPVGKELAGGSQHLGNTIIEVDVQAYNVKQACVSLLPAYAVVLTGVNIGLS